jgi:2-phospho-L-lactate/phosphoenolpyruvate guanylyltransferase
MPVPLVPVKALAEAKGRLAPAVGPLQRRLLAIAMFEDVIAALQAVHGLEAPVVVSPDREVWRRADAMGCRVVEEPPGTGDLNAALAAAGTGAAGGVRGTRCGFPDGSAGEPLLVVAADLPLASAAGLERVLQAAAAAPVAVVPSADGGGTNVLAWRDPATFAPSFGPDSAARHLAVPGAVRVDDPELSLDVDTVEDLRAVAGRLDPSSVTARRLRDLGMLRPRPDRPEEA